MNEDSLEALRQQWLAQHAAPATPGEVGAADQAAARAALEQRIVAAVTAGWMAQAAGPDSAAAKGTHAAVATPVGAMPATAAPPAVPGRVWAAAAAFVLLLAGAGYAWKGTPGAVGTPPPGFENQAGAGAPERTGPEQLQALIKGLEQRLSEKPGDTEGWALMARSQMALGRYAEAATAYEKLLALKPDDANALTDYADTLGVLNGRTLEGRPAQLLERALKLDPRHIKALVLVGTLEFQRGSWAAAQARWEEAVRVGPAGDGLVELAREGVSQAQARLRNAAAGNSGGPGASSAKPAGADGTVTAGAKPGAAPVAAPTPAPAATEAASIRGTVRLADAVKAQAAPGDTVFIFARAAPAGGGAGGGAGAGMPLAILRMKVSELPATFTLDDSQAMSPAARLSSAERVVVTARISKSGQAMPQPGDLEGASLPVAPGAKGLVVEISTVRR